VVVEIQTDALAGRVSSVNESPVAALTLWSRGHTNCMGEQLLPLDETRRRPRDGGVAQLLLASME
jgi:hypothetical protein